MTLLYHFHAQKALFKSPKSAIKFFGLEMTPLPLLELFRQNIRFGGAIVPNPPAHPPTASKGSPIIKEMCLF